jgi:hypothetical protein
MFVPRAKRGFEVARVEVHVDVRRRADVGVAGEHLRELEVSRVAEIR